jgi:hypothetical protein
MVINYLTSSPAKNAQMHMKTNIRILQEALLKDCQNTKFLLIQHIINGFSSYIIEGCEILIH